MPERNLNRAVERSRWLTKLEEALERCDQLSQQLIDRPATSAEAARIRSEIEVARQKVEEIRRARPAAKQLRDPTDIHDELATWRGNRET